MLCKVSFQYGPWNLWANIERHKEEPVTQFELEELAAEAVRQAIKQIPRTNETHIAHDFLIMISDASSWESIKDGNMACYSIRTLAGK